MNSFYFILFYLSVRNAILEDMSYHEFLNYHGLYLVSRGLSFHMNDQFEKVWHCDWSHIVYKHLFNLILINIHSLNSNNRSS